MGMAEYFPDPGDGILDGFRLLWRFQQPASPHPYHAWFGHFYGIYLPTRLFCTVSQAQTRRYHQRLPRRRKKTGADSDASRY